MIVSKDLMKKIEGKLRRPIHITYIANYILKMDIDDARKIINKLVDMDILEEYKYGKEYFGLKSK